MKITFFCNNLSFVLSHRIDLIKYLTSNNFRVTVITNFDDIPPDFKNVRFINYNIKSGINFFRFIHSIFFYRRIIKNTETDIVHVIGLKCILINIFSSMKLKINTILHFTGLGNIFIMNRYFILKLFFQFFVRLVVKKKNVFLIFQKFEDIIKIKIDQFYHKNNNIFIIPGSGVDCKKFNIEKKISKKIKLNVLMASRLVKNKGISTYLEITKNFKSDNKFFFYLAGRKVDTANSYNFSKIKNHRYENFEYLGHIQDMHELLKKIDIVIYPSTYGEGIPKFLLECLASGVSLILSNTDANNYIVDHGLNGFLANNLNEYLFYLNKMTNNNLRRSFSVESKNKSINFDIKHINKSHLDLYNMITNTKLS